MPKPLGRILSHLLGRTAKEFLFFPKFSLKADLLATKDNFLYFFFSKIRDIILDMIFNLLPFYTLNLR